MAAPQTVQIKIQVDSKTGQISLKTMEKGFQKITLTAKQAEQAAKQLNTTVSQLTANNSITATANSYTKLGVSMSGTAAASGTATASVLELGRAISDAPYGIRGVANNLSQLASMFALSARNAGGFTGALKGMWTVLKGPLGILLAVQTAIALMDAFAGSTKKAAKSANSISDSAAKAASNLKILARANELNSMSFKETERAVNRANSEYKDLNIVIGENGKITDESVLAIERKISALEDLAKAQAIQKLIEEEFGKLALLQIESDEIQLEIDNKRLEVENKRASVNSQTTARSVSAADDQQRSYDKLRASERALVSTTTELNEALEDQAEIRLKIDKLIDKIPDVKDIFNDRKKGGGGGKSNSIFKQQVLDLQKFILDTNRKQALMVEENEREQLNIKQDYANQDLLRRKTSFIEKQKLRLEDYLKGKRTDAQIAAAKGVFRDSEVQAETEYQEGVTALTILHTTQRQRFQLELMRQFNTDMIDNRLQMMSDNESMLAAFTDGTSAGMLNKPQSLVGAEDIERQQEAALLRREAEQENFEADLEQKKINLGRQGYELLEIEQLIEADRNEWLMEQMQFELQIERDKIEAKRNINLEYISWVAGLGSIMQGFAKENKAIAVAALVLQKGAAIANVIVQTQSANASIMASSSAAAGEATAHGVMSTMKGTAMMAGGNPLGAGLITAGNAEIASAAGIQATGAARITKNKIGAGISIAAIAASAIGQASMGGSSGGGGGGGAGKSGGGQAPSREFDFNLVGSTGVNQLAQGVGSNFNEPVQAYVVSSQMTSQQQLDNVIQTTASLGD
jgi:hypothetical protein